MRIFNQNHNRPAVVRKLALLLLGLGGLAVSGCEPPDESDGQRYEAVVLPTDTLLNLACADVGIFDNTCVLEDPENPFATVAIIEFDENNPEAANKFALSNQIPPGPEGAKSRFYFWATALARRPSGENQFFTALALHELWSLNSDQIVKDQALKAYRAVLDYFFGSVFFFECCANVSNDGLPLVLPITLNETTADILYRNPTGFRRLVEGDPLNVIDLLASWGYTYRPATPPDFDNGVVGIISF